MRSPGEFASGQVPGAVNIPHDQLAGRLSEIDGTKDDQIVVYCHSGRRAGVATQLLKASGYANVVHFEGHWQGWSKAQL